MTDNTLGFYNANAEQYAADEGIPNPRLSSFLDRCTPNGKILELGTGGGVDGAAIIERGFDLDATDGSPELAAIASRRIGLTVRTMLFNELDAVDLYDGVYACASLTHAPRSELVPIIGRIHRALNDAGLVWASFKAGAEEGTDALGRYYSYLSKEELMVTWENAGPWRSLEAEIWVGGAYDRKPTTWVAITAAKLDRFGPSSDSYGTI
ncbi:methyltransferase [Rhizobium sp. Root1203]|uniref:class I SAM-dependent methyltransferase n=1 Tax=Rhizobium sp. Root1203 TaxID=1736427 RepID=UPI00070F5B76|nr:class I SAM-dependent methyltransferase [Rhizobium sp. Root1203]KQV13198.1 methyltransferase [Rhizobium sp. Root1203]